MTKRQAPSITPVAIGHPAAAPCRTACAGGCCEVGDSLIDVGEVEAAVPGAGFGGDGGQGGGDGSGAAVQHPQLLPVGPFAGGLRVPGCSAARLCQVAADVDEIDEHRDFEAALGVVAMAVSCCLFPSTRNTRCRICSGSRRSASLNATPIMSSMLSVIEAATHLSRAAGPGRSLRRAGGAAMSSGSRTAGVKSATATISAIFLIPGCAASLPLRRLRCSGRTAMPFPSACIMITSVAGRSVSAPKAR